MLRRHLLYPLSYGRGIRKSSRDLTVAHHGESTGSSARLSVPAWPRGRRTSEPFAALDVLDSYGARTLGLLAEMARLRGAETVIVGVSPEIAFTMVRLGMSIANVHTALDLEQGLQLLDRLTQSGPAGAGPAR